MMTDGRSGDSVNGPAQLFRRSNIKCYAVGIGRKFNRNQLLQIAAGDRRHVLTAGFRNLGSIVDTIQRRACRGTIGNLLCCCVTLRLRSNVTVKSCYNSLKLCNDFSCVLKGLINVSFLLKL